MIMARIQTLLILLLPVLLAGQSVPVSIEVVDYEDRAPLVGANVFVDGEIAGSTNNEGKLNVMVDRGSHSLRVSYLGYETFNQTFDPDQLEGPQVYVLLKPSTTLLTTATVTGSRYEKPLAESSVSIDILKPELITRTAAPDIQEVLNRMPGVLILDGQANIRGGSGWSYGAGSRVLLLMDDIPILQVDAAIPNWTDVPIENIGRVEILKGASSALYGSSALNGIINIQTDYAKSEPETHIALQGTHFFMPNDSTDYSQQHAVMASVMHRQKIGRLDLVLGGAYRHEEDFRQGTYLKTGRLNANLRYRLKDNLVIGVNSSFNPGVSSDYFYWDAKNSFRGDATSFNVTDRLRFNIDPFVKWQNDRWSHKVLGRIYRTKNDVTDGQANESWLTYGEYQAQYDMKEWDMKIVGGAVVTNTEVKAELYSDTVFTNRNLAAYGQIEKKFYDDLILTAGLRFEHNTLLSPRFVDGDTIPGGEITESRPVWRFGANYRLAEYTYLRASWGQGYRFPSIAEKFINTQAGAITVRPNTELKSEDGWSSEIGIRQGVGNDRWNGYVDAAIFWSRYFDMMEFSVSKDENDFLFFQSQNVGGTSIYGFEVNGFLTATIGEIDLSFQTGYTFIEPRFTEFDESGNDAIVTDPSLTQGQQNAAKSTADYNVLKYRSKHNYKFDLQLEWANWFGGMGFNYISEVLAFDKVLVIQVNGLEAPQDDDMEGIRTLDIRFGYHWNDWKVQLQLKNAFDERYSLRPAYLEAPRNLTLRLDYSF